MAMRATRSTASCPRCKRPIAVGEWIEPMYRGAFRRGVARWAHQGCHPNQAQAAVATDDMTIQADTEAEDAAAVAAELKRRQQQGDIEVKEQAPKQTGKLLTRVREELATIAGEVFADAAPGMIDALTGRLVAPLEAAEKRLADSVAETIRAEVEKLPPKTIVLKTPNGDRQLPKDEVYQTCFPRLLRLAAARKNIMLIGPTGSGKTHMAKQLADALGLDFGVMSCSGGLTEAKFLGRVHPIELTFRESEFIRIYENGGVFCLDELDGADPNVILILNSAIANGFIGLPDRKDKPIARRHKDFVLVATANTWGHGSTRKFVGRYPIDEATLDRFRVGTIEVGYCDEIEKRLCRGNDDVYRTLKRWRSKIIECGLERVVSTRFFQDVTDMMEMGDTWDDIERSFFGGWRKEEVMKVLGRDINRV